MEIHTRDGLIIPVKGIEPIPVSETCMTQIPGTPKGALAARLKSKEHMLPRTSGLLLYSSMSTSLNPATSPKTQTTNLIRQKSSIPNYATSLSLIALLIQCCEPFQHFFIRNPKSNSLDYSPPRPALPSCANNP